MLTIEWDKQKIKRNYVYITNLNRGTTCSLEAEMKERYFCLYADRVSDFFLGWFIKNMSVRVNRNKKGSEPIAKSSDTNG